MRAVVSDKDLMILKQQLAVQPVPTKTLAGAKPADKPDDYLSQLSGYIPAEILAFYVAIFAAANEVKDVIPFVNVSWLMFALGLGGTLVLAYTTNKKDLNAVGVIKGIWPKTIISTVAFIVWALTLGAPFTFISWWNVFYGTLALMTFTLIAPRLADLLNIAPSPAPSQPPKE